ncbi:MAG: hypothetical protein AAGF84_08355 [Planctomycetota bacterium]
MLIAVSTAAVVLTIASVFTLLILVTLVLYVVDRFKKSSPQRRKR